MSEPGRCSLRMRPWLVLVLLRCLALDMAEALCVPQSGCEAAYAFYRAQANETLDSIAAKFQVSSEAFLVANPGISTVVTNQPLYIPVKCECLQGQLLHMFKYQVQRADTVDRIAGTVFEGLTQASWIGAWNALPDLNFILSGDTFKVPVQCFCGDPRVSLSYGLFLTYVVPRSIPLRTLALEFNTSEALLMQYNPSINWNGSKVDQYAFIPVKDAHGNYPPYSAGSSDAEDEITAGGVLAGVATGVGGALLFLSFLALCRHCCALEHERRQQRQLVANKLRSMTEEPICKAGYNDVKV